MEFPYYLENVWENKGPEVREEIIRFWLSEQVLSEQQAKQRVEQVFLLARDPDKNIVGINTVYKQYNQQLENFFYYYRTYVTPKARKLQMTGEMILEARDYFEARYLDKTDTEAIGMFLEVENEAIKKKLNMAVWPVSNFVYIGKNQRGDHLRVYYFKNALIS
jgi:hypothetical protein